jgi:hypothetical protein
MIYILNVWLKACPKRLLIGNQREYVFSKQIYWYDFHIYKLEKLKVIHHLYFQCLTQILPKTTSGPFGSDYFGCSFLEKSEAWTKGMFSDDNFCSQPTFS